MFFNTVIRCTLLATVVSAFRSQDENFGKVKKNGALWRHVVDSFKSDSFKPVGSSAEKKLQATVYSLTGSIYEYLYFSSNPGVTDPTCSTTPAESFGAFVNVCNVDHGFSFKLQLTDNSCNGFTIQYFGDMYCRNYLGLSQGYAAAGQCRVDPDSNPPNAYLISSCTTQAAPEMTANVLAAELYYTDDCTYFPWGYVGQQLNHCFRTTYNTSEPTEFYSYQCNGAVPTKSIWNDAACTSLNSTEAVTPGCNVIPPSEGGNDNDEIFNPPPSVSTTAFPTTTSQLDTSVYLYCPTAAPTLKPALAQTSYPTLSAPQSVSFQIIQGLTGTDAATLTASALSISTLKTTIAGTMPGITADNIIDFTVANYITSRRQLRWSSFLAPLSSTSVVTMTYVVSANSVYSVDNLYARLTDSIYSGGFTTDLYNNAQAVGATGLYGCSSSFASYTIDWDLDIDNNDLSGGAIAGIVIGVLAFVAIVGALVYFCFCRRRPSTPMSSHGAKPAVELNNKA